MCVCLPSLYSPIFIGVPGGCLISDTFVNVKVLLLPVMPVSKGCLAIKPSHYSHPSGELWANSRWKQNIHHQALSYPKDEPWGDSEWENRMLAPDSWGGHQRNDFSEPRLLCLPIHRKVLNFIKWDVWFSLIYHYLSVFLTTSSLLQNPYIPWLLPYLKAVWEAVPQKYVLSFVHQIKLLGSEIFSVNRYSFEDPQHSVSSLFKLDDNPEDAVKGFSRCIIIQLCDLKVGKDAMC